MKKRDLTLTVTLILTLKRVQKCISAELARYVPKLEGTRDIPL